MEIAHVACRSVRELLAQCQERSAQWLSASEAARLAALRTRRRRDQFLAARWLARCLLSFGYGGLEYFHQYLWAYSLLNLTSICLIFCAIEDAAIARLLSFRPLVFIGTISFGVYVWHLPLMRIFSLAWPAGQHSLIGLFRFVIYFFTTLGVAALSYFCFERHFLRMKHLLMSTAIRRVVQAVKSRTK